MFQDYRGGKGGCSTEAESGKKGRPEMQVEREPMQLKR